MKLIKMSLIAAVLVGSSAFAISNVKVKGDAKLFYNTNTNYNADGSAGGADEGIFGARNSYGQAALDLGLSADLTKGVSAGASMVALSSLGLQGSLVSNVWEGTNGLTDSYWFKTAWIAGTYGKTTAKVGRMALDTPLIFTETWSIVENTFEGAVLVNQDIPDTTLVAAYVGESNGNAVNGRNYGQGTSQTDYLKINKNANALVPGIGGPNRIQAMKNGSNFSQFYNGAYAAGIINNSIKPLKLQAWYYNAPQYVQDWWLEADFHMMGAIAGVEYTGINYNLNAILGKNINQSNSAVAFKLGYDLKGVATLTGAISQTGKTAGVSGTIGGLGAGANLAELGNNAQSKLYTEAWWNYGYVTRADTTGYNVTLTSPVNGLFDLGLFWTHTVTGSNSGNAVFDPSVYGGNGQSTQLTEFTATASKSFGPLDTTLAYIFTKANDQNNNVGYSTVQGYLTYNF